ncbi:MAG: hypothetical protein ACUVS5_07360, partial [Anaerolineae bacterium]
MRIAFVCPFGIRAKGTVPARVLPAARSLARRGHQVLVLIPPWDSPEDAGREEREDGLQVWHLPLPLRSPWGWPAPSGSRGRPPAPVPWRMPPGATWSLVRG